MTTAPRRPWPPVLAALAMGIASLLFHGEGIVHDLGSSLTYSDVLTFHPKAVDPGIPYITKLIEYPVITGIFIHVMGILGGSRAGYYIASAAFLVLAWVAATHLLHRMASDEERKRMLPFWLLTASVPFFLVYNWDAFPVLFSVAAFHAMRKGRDGLAAYFLAFGFSSKFYPVLYLAPLLLRSQRPGAWARILGIFLATTVAINGYFLLMSPSGWAWFFTFNSGRPPNPDSIWGVVQHLIPSLGPGTINALSLVLFAAAAAVLLWTYRRAETLRLCFALTVLFLGVTKVFSPQYVLWLLPFLVLFPSPRGSFRLLEVSNLAVMAAIFAHFGDATAAPFGLAATFVVLRHACLAWLGISALKGLREAAA